MIEIDKYRSMADDNVDSPLRRNLHKLASLSVGPFRGIRIPSTRKMLVQLS